MTGLGYGLILIALATGGVSLILLIRRISERSFARFVQKLPDKERTALEECRISLGHHLDIKAKQYLSKGDTPIVKVTGNYKLFQLFKKRFEDRFGPFVPYRFAFTLDGSKATLTWAKSQRWVLLWVQQIQTIWDELKKLQDRISQDPKVLLTVGNSHELTKEYLEVFYSFIKTSKVPDTVLDSYLSSIPTAQRISLAMAFRGPGKYWNREEGLEHLRDLFPVLVPRSLTKIGMEYLVEHKELLWSSLRTMILGSDQRKEALLWLADHPELLLQAPLLKEHWYTYKNTRDAALKLLRYFPNGESLAFLRSLPQEGDYAGIIAYMESFAADSDGLLTVSEPQENGGLSASEGDSKA